MAIIHHYEQAAWGTHNRMKQEELQEMARKIATSCKMGVVSHHRYGTNNPEQCKDGETWANIESGSMAIDYASEVLPIRYIIHFDCGLVTEIIEIIEK